jgi:hypothetical protein
MTGDPGLESGGDGGSGTVSHDSRPRRDSTDSVGDVTLAVLADLGSRLGSALLDRTMAAGESVG